MSYRYTLPDAINITPEGNLLRKLLPITKEILAIKNLSYEVWSIHKLAFGSAHSAKKAEECYKDRPIGLE